MCSVRKPRTTGPTVLTRPPEIARDLAAVVGPAGVLWHPRDLALYEYDATLVTARPRFVVFPETTEQVAAVVRYAHEGELPLTPRGGATSLSGGPLAVEGGIMVVLTRMDRVLELDPDNHRAVVQPGVINLDLLTALEKRGFFFAPDPASQNCCTLGGNVATNSGGPHCLKYGVTTNHITGVQMVLPDGELLTVGGKALDWPGYDLTGVIVGSEGTFGIVTEITCRILPLPQSVTTMLAVFDALEDASRAVSDIIAAGLLPATLEMMDRPLIHAVQMAFDAGYPEDAEVVLIIEVDGLEAGMARQVERIQDACRRHDVRKFEWASTPEERMALWRGRKGTFGAVANLAPNKLCTDVAVPRTELPRVLAEVMEIGARHGLLVGNVFHAGDGNLHPQVLYDARDPDQVARAQEIDEEITRLAVACGGVLTGEHGIGSCKRKWMPVMFSPADLRAQWALKDVFDPWGRMNPGKVLPGRKSIGEAEPWALPHGGFDDAAARLAPLDEEGVCRPYDAEAVAKLCALAAREGQKLVVVGAGSKSAATAAGSRVICTSGLGKVLRTDPENMTVTVEAGVRWADLQAALAPHGQFVPLHPPLADRATVGGVIAAGLASPHRLRYGACRDLLIGARFVTGGGEVVSIGSRCVKNTSGFALEKLLIGSEGSLGVIVEATFRTLPRPEERRTLCFTAAAERLEGLRAFCGEAVGGPLLPAAVEALTPPLAARAGVGGPLRDEAWTVAVALEGLGEEVAFMAEAFSGLAARHGLDPAGEISAAGHDTFWSHVTDLGGPVAQATCVLSGALDLGAQVVGRMGWTTPLRAGPGTGIIALSPDLQGDPAPDAVTACLNEMAAGHGGRACWLPPRPAGARDPLLSGVAARLCRRLKSAYDPAGILPTVV